MTQAQKRGFRLRFQFWLEVETSEEQSQLAADIEELKEKRKFAPTIRNALRLFISLSKGHTDVLCELFPWIEEQLTDGKPSSDDDSSGDSIQAQLDRIESHLDAQGGSSRPLPASSQHQMTARIGAGNSPSLAAIGDDLEIIKASKTDENASYNMALSAYGIGSLKFSELSDDIIRYGVERGKLDKKLLKGLPEPTKDKNPKPIAGANIALSKPTFDDIALDF